MHSSDQWLLSVCWRLHESALVKSHLGQQLQLEPFALFSCNSSYFCVGHSIELNGDFSQTVTLVFLTSFKKTLMFTILPSLQYHCFIYCLGLIGGCSDFYPVFTTEFHCCCCSLIQLCLTLCDPVDCSMPGFLVLHHLLELVQIHIYWVSDAIQPSRTLSSPSPPAFTLFPIFLTLWIKEWVPNPNFCQMPSMLISFYQQMTIKCIFKSCRPTVSQTKESRISFIFWHIQHHCMAILPKLTSEFSSNRKALLPYWRLWVFSSTKCVSISKTAMVPERRTRGGFNWTQTHDSFSQGTRISFCLWCSGSENWFQFGNLRTSLVVQWIKIHLPVQWTQTWSLDPGRVHILQSN